MSFSESLDDTFSFIISVIFLIVITVMGISSLVTYMVTTQPTCLEYSKTTGDCIIWKKED